MAVAADCHDQLFYWTDVSGGKISRASLEGYDKEVVTRGRFTFIHCFCSDIESVTFEYK